jgi:hypothetical protein
MPKPFAVHLGLAFEAEASRRFSGIPAWSRSSVRFTLDPCFGRSRCSSPVDRHLDRSPPGSPEERCLGRGLLISPFGSSFGPKPGDFPGSRLGPKPLPFTVRCSVSGRSRGGSPVRKTRSGRSRSVFSGRKACRPEPAFFPGGSPSKPKLWRFASEAPCRPRPIGFSGFGSPSKPKPFRFSFGGSVKPKLLVPPGCSTKLADLANAKGKPVASAWRRLRQPPSPSCLRSSLAVRSGAFPAAAWSFVPRGVRPGHNWNLSRESESSKLNPPVDNKDNGGRIRPSCPLRLLGSARPCFGTPLFFHERSRRPSQRSQRGHVWSLRRAPPPHKGGANSRTCRGSPLGAAHPGQGSSPR